MGGVIARMCLGVWLACMTVAAAQLPPEILVDRYLLRADRLMEAKDPKGALEMMGKIVALQEEHGLTLPDEFHFNQAKVALSEGSIQEAIDAANTYLLTAGREGKFYREALELLEDVEQLQTWFDAEQTCAGKSKGAACWMELTGHPGCYVWNDYFLNDEDESVTWTGGCPGGRAQGEGTLKWVRDGGKKTLEATGNLKEGKKHRKWTDRYDNGSVWEGPYVEGKRHGQWVGRFANGTVREGPYMEGKRNGGWVERWANGQVHEGPYVEGKRHGQWVLRLADGEVQEGSFVEGKKQGRWVWLGPTGAVWAGPFVDGKRHGEWVERDADGKSRKGPYVEGEKHGHWAMHQADGSVYEEGPYVDGKRRGHWIRRHANGTVYREGPYVDGEKHGQWVTHYTDESVYEATFVEGERQGEWVKR